MKACGGNSIRIGGANLDKLVPAAQRCGLTVTVGLPLKAERSGFDYGDDRQVARQFEEMKAIVLRHKDNPAVLLWVVGNEIGNDASGKRVNPAVWNAVNDIAKMIHSLDPNHPIRVYGLLRPSTLRPMRTSLILTLR